MDKVSEKQTESLPSPLATSSTAWSNNCPSVEAGVNVAIKPSLIRRWWQGIRGPSARNDDTESPEYDTITRRLDGSPEGYCQIGTFQSSDRNFLLYRGFDYLHCRMLSAFQYDLEQLEDELQRMDEWETTKNGSEKRLVCKENDDQYQNPAQISKEFQFKFKRTRPQLLEDLKLKLREYDELLLKTRDISELQRPSNRDYKSVKSWFINNEPVVRKEWKYILRKEDIVTLRAGRECAGFDGVIEYILTYLDACLEKYRCNIIRRLFMTKSLRDKTSDPNIKYFAPARIDTLVGIIITLIIFVFLVLPVVAMYELSDIGKRASAFEAIGILIIFTLVFGMAMSVLTKAKRHELFAACAAYCAVLVVFIGNFTPQTVVLLQQ